MGCRSVLCKSTQIQQNPSRGRSSWPIYLKGLHSTALSGGHLMHIGSKKKNRLHSQRQFTLVTLSGGYKKKNFNVSQESSRLWSCTNSYKWHCGSDRPGGGKSCHVICLQTPQQVCRVFWEGSLAECQWCVLCRDRESHVGRAGEANVALLSS